MDLAILATGAKRVTEEMFISAAEAVAEQVTQTDFENELIYPRVNDILKVSVNVAVKVAEEIFDSGFAEWKDRELFEHLLKVKCLFRCTARF